MQRRLLIGADGAQSIVRQTFNFGAVGWQYSQVSSRHPRATQLNVDSVHRHSSKSPPARRCGNCGAAASYGQHDHRLAALPPHGTCGPVAGTLRCSSARSLGVRGLTRVRGIGTAQLWDRYASIVWSTNLPHADHLLGLDEAAFLEELNHAFHDPPGSSIDTHHTHTHTHNTHDRSAGTLTIFDICYSAVHWSAGLHRRQAAVQSVRRSRPSAARAAGGRGQARSLPPAHSPRHRLHPTPRGPDRVRCPPALPFAWRLCSG